MACEIASTSWSFCGEPSVWRNSLSTVDLLEICSPSMLCLSNSASRNSLLALTDGNVGTAMPPLTERRRTRGAGKSARCGAVRRYHTGGGAVAGGMGSQEAPAMFTSTPSLEEDGLHSLSSKTASSAAGVRPHPGTYGRFDGERSRSGGSCQDVIGRSSAPDSSKRRERCSTIGPRASLSKSQSRPTILRSIHPATNTQTICFASFLSTPPLLTRALAASVGLLEGSGDTPAEARAVPSPPW